MPLLLLLLLSLPPAPGRTLTVRATAYCPCTRCCGPHARGLTATGLPARGRLIAVDPRTIPLHSRVLINGDTWLAEDTGSAIKGNRIDLLFPTHAQARRFGVQTLTITVLPAKRGEKP